MHMPFFWFCHEAAHLAPGTFCFMSSEWIYMYFKGKCLIRILKGFPVEQIKWVFDDNVRIIFISSS